ncbi:hypothetical protein ACHAWF_013833 [Thalassiosira exigua]
MTKVFASVREAWNGVLSGAVVPNTRRRASCSVIDATRGINYDSNAQREQGSNFDLESNGSSKADVFEYSVTVKLANDEKNEKVDLSSFSDEELRRLKKDDPFLYYSIPSLRRKSYAFDTDDDDAILRDIRSSSSTHRRSSISAEVLAGADISLARHRRAGEAAEGDAVRRGSIVRRDRRLSTEAHPSLICEEMMRELEALDNADSDDDDMSL